MTGVAVPGALTEPAGLRSGQGAAAAGVNIETLRYYERRGLLAEPHRRGSGVPIAVAAAPEQMKALVSELTRASTGWGE